MSLMSLTAVELGKKIKAKEVDIIQAINNSKKSFNKKRNNNRWTTKNYNIITINDCNSKNI